jgi:hypothetical protein
MQKTFTCKHCGKREVVANWLCGNDLLKKKLCFDCDYYLDVVQKQDYVVVDGEIFILRPPNTEGLQGHHGRRFGFKMLETGRHRVCSNVWHLGPVPEKYKNSFSNNAEIVYISPFIYQS